MNNEVFLKLKNPYYTFIIGEAGSNWKCGSYEKDLQRAKDLIKIAAYCGADAVKFQVYRPETTYVSDAGTSAYLSEHGINENINKIFENLSMPYEMIPELAKYAQQQNIIFMASPFSENDAKQIDPYVQLHKVASYEINHVRLLEFLADTKKPILLSTGASTFTEIDFAVNLLKKKNNDQIVLMQCTAKYPTPIQSLNLSVIPFMKSKYNVTIGFSDHSMDPIIGPLLALGYGASVIEKHFTLDRNLSGPDHPFALIPDEFTLMIESIRKADKAKGNGNKEILKEEEELRLYATRSIQAIKNISKGDVLIEGENFDVLRPGNRSRGLEARFLDDIIGKRSVKDVKKGEGITDYY